MRPKMHGLANERFKKPCSNLWVSTEDLELKDSLKTFSGVITQQELSYTPLSQFKPGTHVEHNTASKKNSADLI